MTLTFQNYSMKTDRRHEMDWYEWCIFSPDPAHDLEDVSEVEYQLHPSFPDPIRKMTNQEQRFALFSSGWGNFQIRIKVTYKSGATEETFHYLNLENQPWPLSPRPATFGTPTEENVYQVLVEGQFRWRKVSTIVSRTHLPVRVVEDALWRFTQCAN
jgi:transcription initiation factor IIF auxiliary subunit